MSDKKMVNKPPKGYMNEKGARRGIVNPKIFRIVCFVIISVATIIFTAISILAVWDFTKSDVVWRSITSLGIIVVSVIVLMIANETLGKYND